VKKKTKRRKKISSGGWNKGILFEEKPEFEKSGYRGFQRWCIRSFGVKAADSAHAKVGNKQKGIDQRKPYKHCECTKKRGRGEFGGCCKSKLSR